MINKLLNLTLLLLSTLAFTLTGDFTALNSVESIREMTAINGRIYCATSGGVVIINQSTKNFYPVKHGNRNSFGVGAKVITADSLTGLVYAGLDNGVLCVIDKDSAIAWHDDFHGRNIIFTRLLALNGILVIGTNSGLSFYVKGESPVGYPFMERFGSSSNPYLTVGREIRDIMTHGDTLYILTPYFWAKAPVKFDLPFFENNKTLWTASSSLWTTNGESGTFAYVPSGKTAVEGYKRFVINSSVVVGLLDSIFFRDFDNTAFAAIYNETRTKIVVRSSAWTDPAVGDSLIFNTGSTIADGGGLNAICADKQWNFYGGTPKRSAIDLSNNTIYWNGEYQPFLVPLKMKVDSKGNLYAINTSNPMMAVSNSQTSAGIARWSASIGWRQIHHTMSAGMLPGINDFLIDNHGRLFASVAELFDINNDFIQRHATHLLFDTPHLAALSPTPYTDIIATGCLNTGGHPGAIHYDRENCYYHLVVHDASNFRLTISKDNSLNNLNCQNGPLFVDIATLYSSQYPEAAFDRLKVLTTDKSGNIWFVNGYNPLPYSFGVIGKNISQSTIHHPVFYSINPASPYSGLMIKYGWKTTNTGVPESKRGLEAYLAAKQVNTLASDLYGDIWIATTKGLFYYSEGRDSSIHGNIDGNWRFFLQGKDISSIDFDTLNNAWIGTDSGFYMLDFSTARYPTENKLYGTGDRSSIRLVEFNRFNGLIDDKILAVAVHRESGRIFISTAQGVQMFESGSYLPSPSQPPQPHPTPVSRGSAVQITAHKPGSTVHIYTLSGKQIYKQKLENWQTTLVWHCKTGSGASLVAPGVYLYKCVAQDNSLFSGKIAIVR